MSASVVKMYLLFYLKAVVRSSDDVTFNISMTSLTFSLLNLLQGMSEAEIVDVFSVCYSLVLLCENCS